MSGKMIVNPNALDQYLELFGDEGKDFVADIIDTFLQDASNQFYQLDKSLLDNDSSSFRRAAHTLKTGCATVGAENLSKVFLDLELIGESGDLSSTEDNIENCKINFKLLEKELLNKKKKLTQ